MEMLTQPELKQGEWHAMVLCTKTAQPQLAPISVHTLPGQKGSQEPEYSPKALKRPAWIMRVLHVFCLCAASSVVCYSFQVKLSVLSNKWSLYKNVICAFPDICMSGSYTAATSVIASPAVKATRKA